MPMVVSLVVNTQCKGSVGAKACEFMVQPTPNMCSLGGSTERPVVQRRTVRLYYFKEPHSGVFLQDSAWSASTGEYKTAAVVACLMFTRKDQQMLLVGRLGYSGCPGV